MKMIFCGTPDFAVPALRELKNAGHDIQLVISMPDKPKGRKGEPTPCPVREEALKLGLPTYTPEKFNTDEVYEKIAALSPDIIIVTAYGKIIPKRVLELPKYGCVNEHASILPAYRGAAPIQWAVLDGCEKTGVTIMQMGEGLDDGDMISVCEVPLEKDETSDSLFDKLAEAGAKLLVNTLEEIGNGTAVRTPQPKERTTPYARMITKADGQIDWNKSAAELERFVRGMNSWPGAYTGLGGKTLKIWKAAVCDDGSGYEPGTLVKAGKDGFIVATGNGSLELLEVQAEGKKRMNFADFLRGNKVEEQTKLG